MKSKIDYRYPLALVLAIATAAALYKIFYNPWGTAVGTITGYGCQTDQCWIKVNLTVDGEDYQGALKTLYDMEVAPNKGDKIKVTYLKADPTQLRDWECPYKKYSE